jgi:hypothetical protein
MILDRCEADVAQDKPNHHGRYKPHPLPVDGIHAAIIRADAGLLSEIGPIQI